MIETLLQNAIFVTFLTPVVWLITRIFRRPAIAHVLWVALLLKLITPSILTFSIPVNRIGLVHAIAEASIFSFPLFQGLVVFLWVGGSVATMLIFLNRAEAFRRAIVRSGNIHAPAGDLAREVDAGGRLFPTPDVVLVDAVHSPMMCGVGPYSWILFPKDLWFALSVPERRGLLAHELAHFRRGDCAVRILELIVTILFWWNPILWFIKREIECAEEDCCDVAASKFGPKSYARAIIRTLDYLSEPEQFRPIISALLLNRKSSIQLRLERILQLGEPPTDCGQNVHGQKIFASLLALATLLISPQFGLF